MMKKKIIATILFWGILALIYVRVDAVLQQKFTEYGSTSDTFVTKQFYDLDSDSVDVFFLGSSQNVRDISSMKLLEDYDVSAFSISTSAQPTACTYYYLEEILKKHHPEVLIMDTSMLYENVSENGFRRVADNAPLNRSKLSMLQEHRDFLADQKNEKNADRYFWSYLFPVLQFHQRWKELSQVDFEPMETDNRVFRGNVLHMTTSNTDIDEGMVIHESDEPEEMEMIPNQRENMIRIAEYCKDHDIRLVLIKTPKQQWTWNRSIHTEELADEYGLEFYDFNREDLFTECGFDINQDFHDPSHLNQRGAVKLTDWIGRYLTSEYDLPAAEMTDQDIEELERYHYVFDQGMITTAVYPEVLLESLQQSEGCEILIRKSGDLSSCWTPELQKLWEAAGLKACDLSDPEDPSCYVAHIRRGSVEHEEASDSAIEYEGTLESGTSFKLSSGADAEGMRVGEEIVDFPAGLNICVIDADKGTILRNLTLRGNDEGNCVITE